MVGRVVRPREEEDEVRGGGGGIAVATKVSGEPRGHREIQKAGGGGKRRQRTCGITSRHCLCSNFSQRARAVRSDK